MDRIEDCISFMVGKAAQQVTRRARDLLQTTVGTEHPQTVSVLNSIGGVLRKQGALDEAVFADLDEDAVAAEFAAMALR